MRRRGENILAELQYLIMSYETAVTVCGVQLVTVNLVVVQGSEICDSGQFRRG